MTARYPVLLRLDGEPVVVVGGGPVGERKVRGLLAVGAVVTLVAPAATPSLLALAEEGAIHHESRRYDEGDADRIRAGGYRFVVAATDDALVNRRVVAAAADGGTWANDATAPDGGPAALPAIHRAGPITVAVTTGGAHPGAAAWLRDQVAHLIEPEVIAALELVDRVRAESGPDGILGARLDWRRVLDSGTLDLIREGREAEAKERLQACLSSSSD